MESLKQPSSPVIVFDTPNVFTELQHNPIAIIAKILDKVLTIQESDLLATTYKKKLNSVSDIEDVFKALLKDKFQVEEEGLSAVLDSIKQAHFIKEKKKHCGGKKGSEELKKLNKVGGMEKRLVEMAGDDCGVQRFANILKGPDFPC
jgi:histidyl-tRNA synthetase